MTDRKEALIALRDAVKDGSGVGTLPWVVFDTQGAWVIDHFYAALKGSIERTLALLTAVLPDEGWEVCRTSKYPGMIPGSSQHPYAAKVGWGITFKGEGYNPARALLLAILEALIAKEEGAVEAELTRETNDAKQD